MQSYENVYKLEIYVSQSILTYLHSHCFFICWSLKRFLTQTSESTIPHYWFLMVAQLFVIFTSTDTWLGTSRFLFTSFKLLAR